MAKHTPGPWWTDPDTRTAVNSDDKHIAMVNCSKFGNITDVFGDEHRANARLIAAAPELLAAITELCILSPTDSSTGWNVALNKCNAARIKATGESNV